MKSKSLTYITSIGKTPEELPGKYQENLSAMQEFAEIYGLVEPGSAEAKEAKAEYEDYDEKILEALKRDYPEKTPAPAKEKSKAQANKGVTKWAWVKEGEEVRVDWDHPDKHFDGRYYLKLPDGQRLATFEKVGEGELGGTDERVQQLIKQAPDWVEKKQPVSMPPVDENGNRRIDKAALDALEAHLESLPQTKELHTTPKGKYTEERQQLHTKIITEELSGNACIKRDAPIAILTGGLPGSGKSTFIKKNRDWMANPAIFKVDADEVRSKFPEYKGWNAPQTHEESRDIVNSLIEKIGKNGCSFDVIYDGTMNKAEKYGPLINKLKEEGYRVFVLYMQVDKEISMKRAMSRYQRSGRYVPRFVIEEAAKNGLDAFNEIKKKVDGYVLVDGISGKILEKGGEEIPKDRDYSALSEEAPQPEPKKQEASKPTAYSWKKAVPVGELKPVVLHCQHYHLPVSEATELKIKGTGNRSVSVTAKPGEHIIFDDKGFPVFVMNAASFNRKCTEASSVAEHIEEKHKASKPAGPKSEKPARQPVGSTKPAEAKPEPLKAEVKAEPPKPETPKKEEKPAATSSSRSTVEVIEQEIRDIRKAQEKPIDRDRFKKEYNDLEKKKNNKSYLAFLRKHLKSAQEDGVTLSEAQVVKLGIMLRPLVQSQRGAFIDVLFDNRRVLAPTYDNLLRWTENPGNYDLQGVDTSKKEATTKAKAPKKPSLFELIGL